MKEKEAEGVFFRFEEDFVEAHLRCIPMVVRFKLDACGIKLKLEEWSVMTPAERSHLAHAPCESPKEVFLYREELCKLIISRTNNLPTPIPVPENPAWSNQDEIPYTIQEKLTDISASSTLSQWQSLTDLQRFALVKLSSSGHEHKNFLKALIEFNFLSGV